MLMQTLYQQSDLSGPTELFLKGSLLQLPLCTEVQIGWPIIETGDGSSQPLRNSLSLVPHSIGAQRGSPPPPTHQREAVTENVAESRKGIPRGASRGGQSGQARKGRGERAQTRQVEHRAPRAEDKQQASKMDLQRSSPLLRR